MDEDTTLKVVLVALTGDFQSQMKQVNKDLYLFGKQVNSTFGAIAKDSKTVSNSLLVVGGAIAATLGLAAKAAIDQEESMAKAGGTAAEMAATTKSAFEQVKDSMSGLAASLGKVLLPIIKNIAQTLSLFLNWLNNMPGPLKTALVSSAALVGVIALLGSGLFRAISMLPAFLNGLKAIGLYAKVATVAQWLWNAAMMANPIGLIVAAVAALVAGIVLVIHWLKKGKEAAAANLADMSNNARAVSEEAKKLATDWVELQKAWSFSQTTAGRLGVGLEELEKYLVKTGRQAELTQGVFNRFGGDVAAIAYYLGIDLKDVAADMALTTDKMIDDITDLTNAAKDKARERTDAEKAAIDATLTRERQAHDKRLAQLSAEYAAIMKTINARLGGELAKYQSQIDAIKAEQAASDKAYQDKQTAERVANLKSQILAETDAERKRELQKELSGLLLDIAREKERAQRDLQIKALEETMDAARVAAEKELELEQKKHEEKVKREEESLRVFTEKLEAQKVALDEALKETLANYDYDLKAFEDLLANKLLALETYVKAYNDAMKKLLSEPGAVGTSRSSPTTPANTNSSTAPPKKYHAGGIVPGPIGKPVTITALGGEKFLGAGSIGTQGGSSSTLNVNIGTLINDEVSLRNLVRRLSPLLNENTRRTSFAGVNQGYFSGSSAL